MRTVAILMRPGGLVAAATVLSGSINNLPYGGHVETNLAIANKFVAACPPC